MGKPAARGPWPLPTTPILILPKAQSGVPAEDQAWGCGKVPVVWPETYVLAEATMLCPVQRKH